MRYFKRILSFALLLIIIVSVTLIGYTPVHAAGTGAGLAEWALKAYNEKWRYVYGGATPGTVDCSGLIYSYCGGARVGGDQLRSATASGSVSSGIPRVHGLGLYQPGHVGVYVGDGMAVDARGTQWGVCYQSVYTKAWTHWFKLSAVTYVTNGWEKFNGSYYYYEDGQYVVNCTKTIGGENYTFGSNGKSNKVPSDMSAVANKNSNSGSTKPTTQATQATTAPTTAPPTAPTTQAPTQPEVLQLGSSGDKVTKLQNRLTELGFYSDAVTGYFGEATQAAYKDFQKAAGVTIDGIAGKSDLDILYSSSAPKAEKEEPTEPVTEEPTVEPTEEPTEPETVDDGIYSVGEQHDEVVNIQNKLYELGYFYDDSTGYFGDITLGAVIAFQNANGLEATGEVDENTYSALFSENAVENPNYQKPTEETEPVTDSITANTELPLTNSAVTLSDEMSAAAEANAEVAQQVVMKTNQVADKALSNINEEPEFVPYSIAVAQQNNRNFVLWLMLVGGIVVIAGCLTIVLNKSKKYECAHVKKHSNTNENIRYW